jgi:hypothetical protein
VVNGFAKRRIKAGVIVYNPDNWAFDSPVIAKAKIAVTEDK